MNTRFRLLLISAAVFGCFSMLSFGCADMEAEFDYSAEYQQPDSESYEMGRAGCPSGRGVSYVARDAGTCARILYICAEGFEPFGAGDCGCGCRPQFCGGIAGFQCPDGFECVDARGDGCDPNRGGADCGGQCFPVRGP